MKLKTQLDRPSWTEKADDMDHDRKAAHALMMAIKASVDSNSSRARADALIAKADELMAEWGFDTGEDA